MGLALAIAGVTRQSGCVPPEIGNVNGRSSPKASETAVTVRRKEGKRAVKSAERKSYATHAGRDETVRQAVIENTDNGKGRSSPLM